MTMSQIVGLGASTIRDDSPNHDPIHARIGPHVTYITPTYVDLIHAYICPTYVAPSGAATTTTR